ncbi:MAG: nucleoside deaminase [Ardenticatenaceae bacterium]
MFPTFSLELPNWIDEFLPNREARFETPEARMEVAIELARRNVAHGTGGPFGAAIFEIETGRLVAPGVNLVVPSQAAIAHAEMVAIAMAGQVLGSFDLGGKGMAACELVTSTEPCAMCFGAVPWSGVRRLVCGARDADARAVGFDEGPKLDNWKAALEERDIEVVQDVLREEAADVLRSYQSDGGLIYNGRLG